MNAAQRASAGTAGPRGGAPGRARALRMAVSAAVLAATAALSGCFAQAGAASALQLSTAYVALPRTPGTTVAYVVVHNTGPADTLISARTSVGGRVVFRAPARPGASVMHTVPVVPVPAGGTLSMRPNGYHLLITGAGRMRSGKDIILTLVFARAGAVTVVAQVTNPETGGSTYFLN